MYKLCTFRNVQLWSIGEKISHLFVFVVIMLHVSVYMFIYKYYTQVENMHNLEIVLSISESGKGMQILIFCYQSQDCVRCICSLEIAHTFTHAHTSVTC